MSGLLDALRAESDPARRAEIKAEAVFAAVVGAAGTSFSINRGEQRIVVSDLRVSDAHLVFRLSVLMKGRLVWSDEVHIVNPPLMVRSGGTDAAPTFTESPYFALRDAILDIVARKVG